MAGDGGLFRLFGVQIRLCTRSNGTCDPFLCSVKRPETSGKNSYVQGTCTLAALRQGRRSVQPLQKKWPTTFEEQNEVRHAPGHLQLVDPGFYWLTRPGLSPPSPDSLDGRRAGDMKPLTRAPLPLGLKIVFVFTTTPTAMQSRSVTQLD